MKRRAIIFAALFLSVALQSFSIHAVSSQAAEIIKIAYFNFPPHISFVQDRPAGALVDYWEKYLAPEMAVSIEWVGPLPPVRIFKMLKHGDVNCAAFFAKNSERVSKYDYPLYPFTHMQAAIAVLKAGRIKDIKSVQDLNGLELCFFKDGFIPPEMVDQNIEWDFLYAPSWRTLCLSKLLAKRIDAVFEPDRCALDHELVKESIYRETMVVLNIPGTRTFLYSIFSKADDGQFLSRYNRAHMAFLQDDEHIYSRLMNAFINRRE